MSTYECSKSHAAGLRVAPLPDMPGAAPSRFPSALSFGPRMFTDRRAAGRRLGEALLHHAHTDAIVLGLLRGGVLVAAEVARMLGATLDVWVVRKIGSPFQPELGMGAIAEGPAVFLDRATVRLIGVEARDILEVARREIAEVRRRVERFRAGRPPPELRGRTVILVDDGIAIGGTMRAAIRAVKRHEPARVVVAIPVAAPEIVEALRQEVDEVVCLHQPEPMYAIGLWYEDFRQVRDDEVVRILELDRSVRDPTTRR
jgi:putative phosphoribosyl transferase